MSRIVFENERPPAQVDPARADVACFVGLVRCIPGAVLPQAVQDWLKLQGWVDGPYRRLSYPVPPLAGPNFIADIPIPIETYSAFTTLFDTGGPTDYLAATVRTFFAQGGKRCYVVRMDDPVTANDPNKQAKLQSLVPTNTYAPDDQTGWHGAGHLLGLPDVSFLVMPDLPILTASTPPMAVGAQPVVVSEPARFVECAALGAASVQPTASGPPGAAPRLAPADYDAWAAAIRSVVQFLRGDSGTDPSDQAASRPGSSSLREMLFVAAFPLPQEMDVAAAYESPSAPPTLDIHDIINNKMPEDGTGISSAFLELAYPWLKTTSSSALLEGLEPPDGALAGLLARNALTRGTFTSATKITPAEIFDLWPVLPAQETTVPDTTPTWNAGGPQKPLIERLSLFGFTPAGVALLSDVTTYAGESYRFAGIHRLVAVILRAARRLGNDITFQSNGPTLWARVQTFLRNLMTRLWQLNALDGATASDAFSVRCDSSTMTQNDLDNGRLIAVVAFNAASTIELIRVTLALEASGTSAQSIAAAEAS